MDITDQLKRFMKPLTTRIQTMIVRGVIKLVNDKTKIQQIQASLLAGELKEKVAQGVAWSMAEKIGSMLLTMAVRFVILRLLTREIMGFMAIPTAIMSFAMTSIFICLLACRTWARRTFACAAAAALGVVVLKLLGLGSVAVLLGALLGVLAGMLVGPRKGGEARRDHE